MIPRSVRARVARLGTVVTAVLVSLTAACSLDPSRLPVPGAFVAGDTYHVKIEFSSVLNLPARAKVDFGGVRVGVMDRVQLVGNTAVAHVDISKSITLPQNTRAELRQATILGDIYIALMPPDNPAPSSLHDGDVIPLKNTVPADNVEDILRGVSNLVTGGTLTALQDAVVSFNKAFPKDPAEQDRIRRKLASVLHDLAVNQDAVDEILSSTRSATRTLIHDTPVLDRLMADGPARLEAMSAVLPNVIQLLVYLQDLGRGGDELLVPITPDLIQMLTYLTPFVGSVATADTPVQANADKLDALIRDKLIPFFGNGEPRFTVSQVHRQPGDPGVDAAQRADGVVSTMRTMGMLP